jgi:hypothetical protein
VFVNTRQENIMETVKVDMQKLQLLNERIAQTIEALNQVRMSVHGFQHTAAQAWSPVAGYPYGSYTPHSSYGVYSPVGLAPQMYPQQFGPQYGSTLTPGFQHSSPIPTVAWSIPTYGSPTFASPTYGSPTFASPTFASPTFASPTFASPTFSNGLSHTTWEPRTFPHPIA